MIILCVSGKFSSSALRKIFVVAESALPKPIIWKLSPLTGEIAL
jgi:hypothetical protein